MQPSSDDDDMLELEDEGTSPLSHFAVTQGKDRVGHETARKRRRLDPESSVLKAVGHNSARLGESDSPISFLDPSQAPAGSSPTPSRSMHTVDPNSTPFKYPQPPPTFSPVPSRTSQLNRPPHFAITPSRQIPPLAPPPASSSKFLTYNQSAPSATQTQTSTQSARGSHFILPATSTSDWTDPSGATAPYERACQVPSLLPSAFSPHNRKGHTRFVADGWASQVRGWILDASSDAHRSTIETSVPQTPREQHRIAAARNADGSVKAMVLDVLNTTKKTNDLDEIRAASTGLDVGKEDVMPSFLRARLLPGHNKEDLQYDRSVNDTSSSAVDVLITGQEKRKQHMAGRSYYHAQKGCLIGLGAPRWSLNVDMEGTKKTWLVCAGGWWLL